MASVLQAGRMVQMILARRTDGWIELEDTSAGGASNLLRSKLSLRLSTLRGEIRESSTSPVATAVFFFSSRRRHTRFHCDWSSDVCSSDRDHDVARSAIRGAVFLLVLQISAVLAGAAHQQPADHIDHR